MLKYALGFAIAALLTACASIPDASYSYRFTKGVTNIDVTRTIDCTTDKTAMIVVDSVKVTPTYSADADVDPYTLSLRKQDGSFADNDLSFTYFPDGRLKSINATSTGEASNIVKSAISLGTALLGGAAPNKVAAAHALGGCDIINQWGKGKPVTVNYSKNADLTAYPLNTPIAVPSDAFSAQFIARVNAKMPADQSIPAVQLKVDAQRIGDGGAFWLPKADQESAYLEIKLRKPESVALEVLSNSAPIWQGDVLLTSKETFSVPVPKPAAFGKSVFSLTVDDSGSITQVDYNKTNGLSDALSAASTVVNTVEPTDATIAAEEKAKADRIAQQKRLAQCEANKPCQ